MDGNDCNAGDKMLISLVFPVYNVEKYLDRCITSVLNQSYANIEFILVNDGSTDSSGKLCDEYAKKDARIRVIHQKNIGVSEARNSGLKMAQGSYIGFIDPDDEITSDMVQDFVKIAQEQKPDVICSNITQYAYGNITFSTLRNNLPYEKLLLSSDIKEHLLQPYYGGHMGMIPSACTKMYNRFFLNENHLLFDGSLRRAVDYWFNFYVFQRAKSVYVLDKSYYHYYFNVGSIMRSLRDKQFEMFLKSRNRLLKENERLNCKVNWNKLNTDFFNNVNEFLLMYIRNKSVADSYKKVLEILKHPEFQQASSNNAVNTLHAKLIKTNMKMGTYFMAYPIYWYWSKKI